MAVGLPAARFATAAGAVTFRAGGRGQGELERADQLGTSSAVSSANQYGVLADRPVTVKLSAKPAALGVGSPAAWLAVAQLAVVIAPAVL